MQVKKGIAVSPGIAIYPAIVVDAEDQPVIRRSIGMGAAENEHARVQKAIDESKAEVQALRETTARSLGDELAKIFSFHAAMLSDKKLVEGIRQKIDQDQVTAEYAVYRAMRELSRTFLQAQSGYMRERVKDVRDLQRRILRKLMGTTRDRLASLDRQSVLIAHDLTPSQTASLDTSKIKALATNVGGRTSHTAILAHALGIPAVVGLDNVTSLISSGVTVIVDGDRGLVLIDPDEQKLKEYRQQIDQQKEAQSTLGAISHLPAHTRDGVTIDLLANIEFPSEVDDAIAQGAVGVGLYRSEFLYIASDQEPTEQQQYEAYTQAIEALEGRPLTIRTFDLGADKVADQLAETTITERNPFLGCRSIRLCLQNLNLFKTQLRAILRAAVHGPVRIMFPLISSITELRQAKMVLEDVKEDLEDQNINFCEQVEVGMMVEVPSAALQARLFAREVDFFSIGTNDLIQYTVAVDRGNERIASLYSGAHPAVISLIKQVVRAADRAGIDVSVCGEMAGESQYCMLLLGLGIRKLSVAAPAINKIKQIVRQTDVAYCEKIARKVSRLDSDIEIYNCLKDELKKLIPEPSSGRSSGQ